MLPQNTLLAHTFYTTRTRCSCFILAKGANTITFRRARAQPVHYSQYMREGQRKELMSPGASPARDVMPCGGEKKKRRQFFKFLAFRDRNVCSIFSSGIGAPWPLLRSSLKTCGVQHGGCFLVHLARVLYSLQFGKHLPFSSAKFLIPPLKGGDKISRPLGNGV